jgi:hypothetical protein
VTDSELAALALAYVFVSARGEAPRKYLVGLFTVFVVGL